MLKYFAFCYFHIYSNYQFVENTIKRVSRDNRCGIIKQRCKRQIFQKTVIYEQNALSIFIQETEVKNEVQDCPENDSVPGGELYIDENAEEKEQEYPDPMEKADYGALYGANQYYNRYLNIKSPDTQFSD